MNNDNGVNKLKNKYNLVIMILVVGMITISCASAPLLTNGNDIIDAMYNKYEGKWMKYLTFEQNTINYRDGKEVSNVLWHEYYKSPSSLRIDFGDPELGNAMIFHDAKFMRINDGVITNERDYVHPLMVILYSVYSQNPEITKAQLQSFNYDLEKVHSRTIDGKNVYVVGAINIDDKVNQFWVDKESMQVIKDIKYNGDNKSEIEMSKFEKHGDSYFATYIVFKNNGVTRTVEEYFDIVVGKEFSDKKFTAEDVTKK